MRLAEKREWMALPYDPAPAIEVPEYSEKTFCGYHRKGRNYIAGARTEGDTLIFTVYSSSGAPVYRTFQKPDELFSQFPGREKPSDATIANALDGSGWYHMMPEDTNLVRAWCKNNAPFPFVSSGDGGVTILKRYQEAVRKTELNRRRDRTKKMVDEVMKEIHPLPQKVLDWIRDEVMKPYRYIFYNYQKGKKIQKGFCSYCNQMVDIQGAKHKGTAICPHCHSEVTLIANGKYRDKVARMQDQSHFVYIQPTKDGWCARYFDVVSVMDGRGDKDSSRYHHKEIGRYFYSTQKSCYTGFYEWKNFFQTGEMRFCKVDERFSMPCKIYPKSLNAVRQKDSRLRYIPLEDIAAHIKEDACLLIDACWRTPLQVEYMAKLGLYRMLEESVSRYGHKIPEGKTPAEMFGLSGQPLKAILKTNPSWGEVETYRKITENQKNADVDVFCRLYQKSGYHMRLPELARYLSLQKIENYLEKQEKLRPEVPEDRRADMILGDWLDYLKTCKKLGYDMKEDRILRPKNLAEAHDEVTVLLKEKEDGRTREGIQRRAKKAQKYAWEQDGFLIRPIATLKELVAEGTKLKHCVAGYASSYAEGRCKLFCIRKKSEPDTPYYTLELGKNDRLVQCRGYRNDIENGYKMQKEVEKFVEQWMSKVVNPKKKKKERIKVNAA